MNDRNSKSSTRKISTTASTQHDLEIAERLLLLLIGAAVFDANRRRQLQLGDCLLHRGHARPHIHALEAGRHFDEPLQIFAADLRLARKLLDRGDSEPSVAVPPDELTSIVLLIASSDARADAGKRTRSGYGRLSIDDRRRRRLAFDHRDRHRPELLGGEAGARPRFAG